MSMLNKLVEGLKKNIRTNDARLIGQADVIRAKWLQSFYVYLIASILSTIFVFRDRLVLNEPIVTNSLNQDLAFMSAIIVITFLCVFWAPYYFGYKRGGTISLLLSFVIVIKSLIDSAIGLYSLSWSEVNYIELIIPLTLLILGLIYAMRTITFYQLNAAIKRAKSH